MLNSRFIPKVVGVQILNRKNSIFELSAVALLYLNKKKNSTKKLGSKVVWYPTWGRKKNDFFNFFPTFTLFLSANWPTGSPDVAVIHSNEQFEDQIAFTHLVPWRHGYTPSSINFSNQFEIHRDVKENLKVVMYDDFWWFMHMDFWFSQKLGVEKAHYRCVS